MGDEYRRHPPRSQKLGKLASPPLSLCSIAPAVRAEQSKSCQQCRDQQQACSKNYAGKVCKTEYDICMKSCQAKNSRIEGVCSNLTIQPDTAAKSIARRSERLII